jgi:predicted signal transduction protein with EAL and GGDEF domain
MPAVCGSSSVSSSGPMRLRPLTPFAQRDDQIVAGARRAGQFDAQVLVPTSRLRSPVDLDCFKDFNDNHGHLAGDELLKDAAIAWRRNLRATDVLARYGGEEFALALPSRSRQAATATLGRLSAATPAKQTVSAGIATWDGEENAETLMERVDRALYKAKHTGRNRIIAAQDNPGTRDRG